MKNFLRTIQISSKLTTQIRYEDVGFTKLTTEIFRRQGEKRALQDDFVQ